MRALCAVALLTLSATLSPEASRADVLADLVTQRSWIGYSPRNYNPNINQQPSEASMRADLEQLYDAGWRHVYNYTLDGTQREFPRIAKEVGFDNVLAGVFFFDNAQLEREKSAAQQEDQFIDGYLVGNEGLAFGRYSGQALVDAIDFFDGFGKPVATTEVGGLYLVPEAEALNDLGDFTTVNIQPWFNGSLNTNDPAGMARAVRDEYVAIQAIRPDRLVVIKEAWWPTDAQPSNSGANEANQVAFFQALANETDANGDPLLFMWGESHDQPWKTGEASPFGALGPDWGFYESNGTAKQLVTALDDVYTAGYPVNFLPGDYDRDGVIDVDDETVWRNTYGSEREIAGSAADGSFDRLVNAADYTVWRDASAATSSAAVPETNAAALLLSAAAMAHLRRFRFFFG